MADNENTLTSAAFSQQTGLAVSTITQMLRQGKLHGEKRGGKWAIFASELHSQAVGSKKKRSDPDSPGPIFETPVLSGKAYDIDTFTSLTYLTENGVRQWFKTGRLDGRIDAGGKVLIDAANLDRPEFQYLVRK